MLYFKTKKGRLLIQILIDSSKNECVYMLIASPAEHERSLRTISSYVEEKIWSKFEKIAAPQELKNNEVDHQVYCQALDDENTFQQEMADMDWEMSKAYHQ